MTQQKIHNLRNRYFRLNMKLIEAELEIRENIREHGLNGSLKRAKFKTARILARMREIRNELRLNGLTIISGKQ